MKHFSIPRIINAIIRKIVIVFSKSIRVKKNRIYFSSFSGRFCDSPKQIALYYSKHYSDSELIYSVNDISVFSNSKIIPSKTGTWKDTWYRETAEVIVDNYYGGKACWLRAEDDIAKRKFNAEINRNYKKGQTVISTWHGTPLKRMGVDSANSNIMDFDCPNTILLLGNQWTADVMDRLTFHKLRIEVTGSPRNDPLIENDLDSYLLIKSKLNIPLDSKVLLYAPTFRDSEGEGTEANIYKSGLEQLSCIDVNRLLESLSIKFGSDWIIILRFHHYVEQRIDWNSLKIKYGDKVINGNLFDDMVDYLCASDILVTDASSCFFDFALTFKPCFLFFPDADQYIKDRGLYFDFADMPFPFSRDFDGLIETISEFNQNKYKEDVEAFLSRIGNSDDGLATSRITEHIRKIISL